MTISRNRLLTKLGFEPKRPNSRASDLSDIPQVDMELLVSYDGYTMTSLERRYHLLNSIRYLVRRGIPGAIVECGVWRGGSMMLVAKALLQLRDTSRELFLYDTYNGMPAPSEVDKDHEGTSAAIRLRQDCQKMDQSLVWAIAALPEVEKNIRSTGYPMQRVRLVAGAVETTIPSIIPEQIALLRLDTDWYESTAHELNHLYPRVVEGGVVIIDDYGYWQGARKATDEFVQQTDANILLHRIDQTGRAFVKVGSK